MSTSATVTIDKVCEIFYTSSDGYPDEILPELRGAIKEVQEIDERNPDVSFKDLLFLKLRNIGWEVYNNCDNHFGANYEYRISLAGDLYWRGGEQKDWLFHTTISSDGLNIIKDGKLPAS